MQKLETEQKRVNAQAAQEKLQQQEFGQSLGRIEPAARTLRIAPKLAVPLPN